MRLGKGQTVWRLLVLGLIGIGVEVGIPFASSAAVEVGLSERSPQILVEVDPTVLLAALVGTGGSAWVMWSDLQDVASLTAQQLLKGCGGRGVSISNTELPRRFSPIAEALGAGAMLASALLPSAAERPGRPASAGIGAWFGAWLGYLLGVRSFALGMLSPSYLPEMAPPEVRLEWVPNEPVRLVVEGATSPPARVCGAVGEPARSRTPTWALWVSPLVGAIVGAVGGYSLDLRLGRLDP